MDDAKISQKLAELDEFEDVDLQHKDADDQSKIKQDYARRRLELKQQLEAKKAVDDIAAKQAAVDAAKKELADNKSQADALEGQLGQAYDVVNNGPKRLADAGVQTDAQGAAARLELLRNLNNQVDDKGNQRGLSKDEEAMYKQDQGGAYPDIQKEERENGPSYTPANWPSGKSKRDAIDEDREKSENPNFLLNQTPAQREAWAARAEDDKARSEALQKQIDAILQYQAQVTEAKKQIEDSVPKFQELNAAAGTLTTKIQAAATDVEKAKVDADTLTRNKQPGETTKLNEDQRKETAERRFENFDAQNKAAIDKLDTEIKATTDETLKAVKERQKAALEATGIVAKANLDLSTGKIGHEQFVEQTQKATDIPHQR